MPSAYTKSKMKDYMQEAEVIEALQKLVDDASYITSPCQTADKDNYPEGTIPFIENHVAYLRKHPQVDPKHYLSNLRLMLKTQ